MCRFQALVFVLFWAYLVGSPLPVRSESGGQATVVLIASEAKQASFVKVIRALRSQLSDVDVNFQVHWVPRLEEHMSDQVKAAAHIASQNQAFLVFWCDFSTVERMFLYLAEPDATRVLVREVDRVRDGVHGRYLALAAIVRSSIDAMLTGGHIGVALPRREAEAGKRPPFDTSLGLGYALGAYADARTFKHTGRLTLGISLSSQWHLVMAYAATPGLMAADETTELRIDEHRMCLGVGVTWPLDWLRLEAALVTAVGLIDRRTSVTAGHLTASPDGLDVNMAIEATFRVGIPLQDWMVLYTGPGAAFMLRNAEYGVSSGASRTVLLSPWTVQPFWVVELAVVID